jgi:hypothetical protein
MTMKMCNFLQTYSERMHCLDVASIFKINGSKSYVDNIKYRDSAQYIWREFSFGLQQSNARLRSHESEVCMYRFLRTNITEISIFNRFEFHVNPRAIPLARVG